jgi:hypothetical protein
MCEDSFVNGCSWCVFRREKWQSSAITLISKVSFSCKIQTYLLNTTLCNKCFERLKAQGIFLRTGRYAFSHLWSVLKVIYCAFNDKWLFCYELDTETEEILKKILTADPCNIHKSWESFLWWIFFLDLLYY